MTLTVTDLTTIDPISHHEARGLAETEYDRFATALAAVRPDEWGAPTDCPDWTVRDLAGHVVGAMRSAASVRHQVRELAAMKRRARRLGGPETDHLTALQVEATAALSTHDLVAECRDLVGPAAAGRHRVPALLRRMVRLPVEVPGLAETWTLGYLVDTILTRDTWMHRVDLARATDRTMDLDDHHDARIVADIAREWAHRHGEPVRLTLTGPAGGRYVAGEHPDTPIIELDAVEFCRVVSRRAPGGGLLAQAVPF